MTNQTIKKSLESDTELNRSLEKFDQDHREFESKLDHSEKYLLNKYLHSLGNRLHELHNELERRDSLIRTYKDDFECPSTGEIIKDKILYDEREWRSVAYIDTRDYEKNQQEYYQAICKRYLPERFNLNFSSNDLVAILVDEEAHIKNLTGFIINNETLLNPDIDNKKIQLFQAFQDNPKVVYEN